MKATRALGALVISLALVAAIGPVAADSGTSLSVILDPPVVTCAAAGGGGSVTVHYTVVSTGAADAATVTATIGGVTYQLPTIAAGNVNDGGGWTFSGRTKTAEGDFTVTLANGSYSLSICVTQDGANGRTPKTACGTIAVVVNCLSTDPCANVGPFGEVPANRNLCKANGNIEIQFRGAFGETASLRITGPATDFTVDVDRAGDSCNYHYNWNPPAGQQAGVYVFSVNGGALEFSATLVCDLPLPHN